MFFMFVDGPLSGRYEEICRTSDGDVFRYSAPNPESVSDITEIILALILPEEIPSIIACRLVPLPLLEIKTTNFFIKFY